jgi:hypothetical protein
MALDAQAITRIIGAVEAGARRKFPDIDRSALQEDIEHARTFYDEMKAAKKPEIKKFAKGLGQIGKLKDQFNKIFEDCTAQSFVRVGWKSPEEIRNALDVLHSAKASYDKPIAHDPLELLGRPGSPFERISGQRLHDIFVSHFKIENRYTHTKGKVTGPFIAFAHQTLIELGIFKKGTGEPYSRQSISSAIKKIKPRKGKKTRG